MALPFINFSHGCCSRYLGSTDTGGKIAGLATALDALIAITSLVIGILGIVGVIGMPPAAAYSLIGLSGAIVLLYVSLVIKDCCGGCAHGR